jgi:hypothetical protein
LKEAAGVCGGCAYAVGIESVFACNGQKNKELEERGEKRFRTLEPCMMSEVSHAQRPSRQRLRSNRLLGKVKPNCLKSTVIGKFYEWSQ